jgi:hypothetical protein
MCEMGDKCGCWKEFLIYGIKKGGKTRKIIEKRRKKEKIKTKIKKGFFVRKEKEKKKCAKYRI